MLVKVFREDSEEVLNYLEFNGYKNPEFIGKEDIYYVETLGKVLQDVNIIYSSLEGFSLEAIAYLNKSESNDVDKEFIRILVISEINSVYLLRILVKFYCYYGMDKNIIEQVIALYKPVRENIEHSVFDYELSAALLEEILLLIKSGTSVGEATKYLKNKDMSYAMHMEACFCIRNKISSEKTEFLLNNFKYSDDISRVREAFESEMPVDVAKHLLDSGIKTTKFKYVVKALHKGFSTEDMAILIELLRENYCSVAKLLFVLEHGYGKEVPVPQKADYWLKMDKKSYFNSITGAIIMNEKLDDIIELIEMGVKPKSNVKGMSIF